MEDNKQQTAEILEESVPGQNIEPVSANPAPVSTIKSPSSNKKWLFIFLAFLLLSAVGVGAWFLFMKDKPTENKSNQISEITNFKECVAAGYPIMESFPEQCRVPGGQTFVNATKEDVKPKVEEVADTKPKCSANETLFADKSFGAAFCYPSEWGTASVMDAKIDTSDTGYREAVRFSANTKFIVGGVSEDWTTTIGRGVGCQEPSNSVPSPDSYDTEWHDVIGTGADIEFATRGINPALATGSSYDINETVSSILDSGVCVQGHTVINGSRYLVLSAAYYIDFSAPLGITTPKAHIDSPNTLFTLVERLQLEKLLSSAVKY